jgi:hypothetical protein
MCEDTPNQVYTVPAGSMELVDIERHHGVNPLYSPVNGLDVVGRMPYYPDLDRDMQGEMAAEVLFHLAENYDIQFSGIGNSAPEPGSIDGQPQGLITYSITGLVDGVNMLGHLRHIPIDITVGTLDKILHYYEDMLEDPSDRQYIADLCLRQFMYGRLAAVEGQSQSEPDAYLVDIDNFLSNRETELARVNKDPSGFRMAIGSLVQEIAELERTFPQHSFAMQKERLTAIATALGIEFEAPVDEAW